MGQEAECRSSNDVIWCILSYGGEIEHILINYTMLAVQIAVNLKLYSDTSIEATPEERRHRALQHVLAFLFVWAFQLSLCAVVGCSGISIVWNAMAGWVLAGTTPDPANRGFIVLLLPAVCVDAFYMITTEAMTTVAHICAILLGAGLYAGVYRSSCGRAQATGVQEDADDHKSTLMRGVHE